VKGEPVAESRATPKTVLLVSPLPPPSGGIASWTRILLAKGLPGGFKPVVVNTAMAGYFRGPRVLAFLRELVRTLKILSSMLYKTIRHRPHIVHLNCSLSCNGIFRDLACGVIARMFRKPLLTQYHGDIAYFMDRCGPKFLRRFALQRLMRISRINVALNADSLAWARRLASPGTCTLLANFIEDDVIAMAGQKPDRPGGRVRALYVGNFLAEKGVVHIRAVSGMVPDVQFHLIGEDIEGIFDGPGDIPENITISAPMDRRSVLEKMRESDLYVFASRSEGFPNSVLEAMAMGLPIVATRVGAIPEMVEDGKGGFLVARGDIEGLAGAVRSLAGDPGLRGRMGSENWERSKRFAYSVVVAELAALYRTLL
jgi:glycosyltransferase involved in cell wall biosynthesis